MGHPGSLRSRYRTDRVSAKFIPFVPKQLPLWRAIIDVNGVLFENQGDRLFAVASKCCRRFGVTVPADLVLSFPVISNAQTTSGPTRSFLNAVEKARHGSDQTARAMLVVLTSTLKESIQWPLCHLQFAIRLAR
jgi:hypothetical protein